MSNTNTQELQLRDTSCPLHFTAVAFFVPQSPRMTHNSEPRDTDCSIGRRSYVMIDSQIVSNGIVHRPFEPAWRGWRCMHEQMCGTKFRALRQHLMKYFPPPTCSSRSHRTGNSFQESTIYGVQKRANSFYIDIRLLPSSSDQSHLPHLTSRTHLLFSK